MRRRKEASLRLTKSINRRGSGESTFSIQVSLLANYVEVVFWRKDPHDFERSFAPKVVANFETLSQEMFVLKGKRQTKKTKTIPQPFWDFANIQPISGGYTVNKKKTHPVFLPPNNHNGGWLLGRQPLPTKSLSDGQTQTEWLRPGKTQTGWWLKSCTSE